MKHYFLWIMIILLPLAAISQIRHSKGIAFVDLQAGVIYQGLRGYSFAAHGGKYLSQKLFFRAGFNRNEFDYEAEGSHYIFERKVTNDGNPYLDTLWTTSRRHFRYQTLFLSGDMHLTFFQPNEFLFVNAFGGVRLGMEKRGDITDSVEDLREIPNDFAASGYFGLELELFLGSSLALIGQVREDIMMDDEFMFRPSAHGGIKISFK